MLPSMDSVVRWLEGLGLGQYAAAFVEADIDPAVLADLSEADLAQLGMTLGHRKKLLRAIAASPPAGSPSPRDMSRPISEASVGLGAERRQLTVMFCDLVGGATLAGRLDPEDLREVIGAYHKCVAAVVGRLEGFVAKYMGDRVLVYFGYPQAHEDDTEQAVRAGLALIDAVGELQAPERLRARIGIATGLVVVGDAIGQGSAKEQAIVGETPNLAARLQALAEPNAVIIAESTLRQIGSRFDMQDLGPQSLKGFAEPQRAWRVLAENRALGRFEALRSGKTPLIGRDEEIELLLRRWAQAKRGSGRVVLIAGEPGVGKSRLADALGERIRGEQHMRLHYFCSPHHQDSALYPVIAQMERAADFTREDATADKLEKLQTLLATSLPSSEDVGLIAGLHGLPSGQLVPGLALTAQKKKEKAFEALLRHIEHLAREHPVLMVFEDLHWVDPSSRELLDHIIERIEHWPVLLLATFRPEFQAPWTGQSHMTTLTLTRLDRLDTTAMVENIARHDALPVEIVQEIVERTDGVPLFIEELTKAVLESGLQRASALSAVPHLGLQVPGTLHASLLARLDRLGPAAKDLAQKGSVIGREFGYALLASIADQSEPQLQAVLDRLINSGLLFARGMPPQSTYMFKHALVQDAAYQSMLKSRRAQLHARIADVLEGRFPELVDSEPETLARHWTAAGLAERAIPYWLAAGQRALQRSAIKEAIRHFNAGVALLADVTDETRRARFEVGLQSALGFAWTAIRGYGAPEVEAAFSRAYQLYRTIGETSLAIPVLRGFTTFHWARGNFPTARSFGMELVEIGERTSDHELSLVAHGMLAGICHHMGEIAASEIHLEVLHAAYDPQQRRKIVVRFGEDTPSTTWSYHGFNMAWLGHVDSALVAVQDAVEWARRTGHPLSIANALTRAAVCPAILCDPARASLLAERGMASAQELGFPIYLALANVVLGWASALDGKAEQGVRQIQHGMAMWRSTGAASGLPFFFGLLSEAMLARGDIERALTAADEGCQWSATNSEHTWGCRLHCARGDAQSAAGEVAAAEASYHEALSWSRERSAKFGELYAGIRLARLWRSDGRAGQQRELLAPLYGWFTEGFDNPVLKEAKARLDECTPSRC